MGKTKSMDDKAIENLLKQYGYSDFGARQQRHVIDMLDGDLVQAVLDYVIKQVKQGKKTDNDCIASRN